MADRVVHMRKVLPYRGVWKYLCLLSYCTFWQPVPGSQSVEKRENDCERGRKKCERVKEGGREGVLNKRKRICA